MSNIYAWHKCDKEPPKKKGWYILMVGIKGSGWWWEINVVKALWNGHTWIDLNGHTPMQWTFIKPNILDKYPNYSLEKKESLL